MDNGQAVRIRLASVADIDSCIDVLRALPEYFTSSTYDDVERSMHSPMSIAILAESDGNTVAFALAKHTYPVAAEITYAAVKPQRHRRGHGTAVLRTLIDVLAEKGIAIVQAKTLDVSSGYQPYVATRAFWEAQGFVQIDCIDPLPGWELGNPSAIYVKALRTT